MAAAKPRASSAYWVEMEKADHCEACGRGGQWYVIGPDDVALGVSFDCKEAAEELAEHMSTAFNAGRDCHASDMAKSFPFREIEEDERMTRPRTHALREIHGLAGVTKGAMIDDTDIVQDIKITDEFGMVSLSLSTSSYPAKLTSEQARFIAAALIAAAYRIEDSK